MWWPVLFVSGLLGFAAYAAPDQEKRVETETPFFCNLKALTPTQRQEHQLLTERMAQSIRKTIELADGYGLELDAARLSIRDLATWVDYERRCCPFFDFVVEWRRENGPLTLRLTGREGVKAFIQAEFAKIFH